LLFLYIIGVTHTSGVPVENKGSHLVSDVLVSELQYMRSVTLWECGMNRVVLIEINMLKSFGIILLKASIIY